MQRRLLAWIAIPTAILGLTLLVFQNLSAICGATELFCAKATASSAFPVAPDGWKRMEDEEVYAKNWERRTVRAGEVFPQVVTVFETPMSSDRRIGVEIASGEYLELFKVHGDRTVTVQLRADRGSYWLHSRQTFDLSDKTNLMGVNPEADPDSFRRFVLGMQNEIDATRHLLLVDFKAPGNRDASQDPSDR